MLTMTAMAGIKREFDATVARLGVPATWSRAKAPQTSKSITVGFRTAGIKDTEIVNAYGINAVVITVRELDLDVAPEKFDTFMIQGVRHTADAVHPVHLNGSIIGWKVYVRGAN